MRSKTMNAKEASDFLKGVNLLESVQWWLFEMQEVWMWNAISCVDVGVCAFACVYACARIKELPAL